MESFTISIGQHARDQFWKPIAFDTKQAFCEMLFSGFRYGPKDGRCMVSGHLVGGDRGSNLTIDNSLVMLDHDNGITIDEVEEKIRAVGLQAILWTTHSHLKTSTDVGQGGIAAHRKRKRFGDDVADIEVVRDYLKERKQWTAEMLASIESVEDYLDPKKGMQIKVSHGPMPKVRSLFFLEKPFQFTAPGTVQKDRIAEWKDRIKGFAFRLELPFDSACQDPAHLMYLPACANEDTLQTHKHEIRFIDGNELTLVFDFVRYSEIAPATSRVAERDAEQLSTKFSTLGLASFIRRGGPAETFRAADWYRDACGQEPRRTIDGVKIHFECPNDAEHSNAGDPKDTAFFTQNADETTGAKWMLHCRHDSCQTKFAADRARLLDFACEQFGITDANDLLPYTDADTLDTDADTTDYDALGDIDAMIAEVTNTTPATVIDAIVKYLARFPAPSPIAQDRRVKTLATNSKLGTRSINNAIKMASAEILRQAPALPQETQAIPGAEETSVGAPPPPDDPADTRTIYKQWGFEDKIRVLIGAMEAANVTKKCVFLQADGTVVRVVTAETGVLFSPIMSPAQWAMSCRDLGIRFVDAETQEPVAPFKDLMTLLTGYVGWKFPVVERAVEVPVFGSDGTLETAEGYHVGSRCYLDPRIEFIPVPETVTDDDVGAALNIIGEVLADFPFSDVFSGADPLPVRPDPNSKAYNHERGISSRANAHAMLLQPFARSLIGAESTPLYFIDKSEKGTGANYLANVLGYMLYGTPMPPQMASEREEELEKAITASLYEGRPTIFLDNLNHELSSAALASALTSGVWSGRLLGRSQMLRLPVRALWLLAANNGAISEELMRRVVPIRLDAALANPASDRPPSYYVIENLMQHLRTHRQDLIWAAHVLIKNYVQEAADPALIALRREEYPYPILQSFQGWSEVMGDILACAGVPGFLGNLGGYKSDNESDDKSGLTQYVNDLRAKHKDQWFDLDDALMVLQGITDRPLATYSIVLRCDMNDDAAKKQRLGMLLTRSKGRAFDTTDHGVLQIEKQKRKNGPTQYRVVTSYVATPNTDDLPPSGADLPPPDTDNLTTVDTDTGEITTAGGD